MTLTEARLTIRSALGAGAGDFSDSDVDRALRHAGTDFIRATGCTRKTSILGLTANQAEIDLSGLTLFRPERLIEAEIMYRDKGTWTTTTVAEVYTATPATVQIGDVFTLTIVDEYGRAGSVSFTAAAATVANVTAGLTAAWNASTNAAVATVTAADDTTHVTLTGDVTGFEFTLTGSTTDGGGANTQTLILVNTIQGSGPDDGDFAVRDLVVGDGSPDAYLYVCVTAHTAAAANEPGSSGGSAYWSQVQWKRGTVVAHRSFREVAEALRTGFLHGEPNQYRVAYQPGLDQWTQGAGNGVPRAIGFLNPTTGYLYPCPDAVYSLALTYVEPLTEWTIGGTSVTLNIPDEYLEPVLWYGAPAVLETPDPNDRATSTRWQLYLNARNEMASRFAGAQSSLRSVPVDG
jgi:hypothetical protein